MSTSRPRSRERRRNEVGDVLAKIDLERAQPRSSNNEMVNVTRSQPRETSRTFWILSISNRSVTVTRWLLKLQAAELAINAIALLRRASALKSGSIDVASRA